MALLFAPGTEKVLAAMSQADRTRLIEALREVAASPGRRFSFVTELKGQPGAWRLRKGSWRAVYRVDGDDVLVERVGHRREIYR